MTPGKRTGLGVGKPENVLSLLMALPSLIPLPCPLSRSPHPSSPKPCFKDDNSRTCPSSPTPLRTHHRSHQGCRPPSFFLETPAVYLQCGALRCPFTSNLFITI